MDDAIALMEGFGEQTLYPNILGAEGKIAEINGDYQKAVEKYQQYYQLKKLILLFTGGFQGATANWEITNRRQKK